MGARRPDTQFLHKKNLPGPGAYDPSLLRSKSSIFIGASTRPEVKDNHIPGPGYYEIHSRPCSSASFGTSKRNTITNVIECQNSYDLPTTIGEGPKFSIGPKIKIVEKTFTPGPGAYNFEEKNRIPAFFFGTSKREVFSNVAEMVGPIYNLESKNCGPMWKFGSDERKMNFSKTLTPGPGAYHSKSTLNTSMITLKIRHKDLSTKYIISVPGPGTYDNKVNDKSPSWSIGKASRGLEWAKLQNSQNSTLKNDSELVFHSQNPNLLKKSRYLAK